MIAVVPPPGYTVTVTESLSRDLVKVSEWRDLYLMKLNASKTKTMMLSRSSTMHAQSPTPTIAGIVYSEQPHRQCGGLVFQEVPESNPFHVQVTLRECPV